MQPAASALTLHGRAMFRAVMPLVEGGEIGRVHIASEGEWKGHPTGAFQLTRDTFRNMVRLFERETNPKVVDFEHQSMRADQASGPTPAAGWIQSLSIVEGTDGAELWASVEWTDRAAEMIKRGEYKFCSPVIDWSAIDRKTGKDEGAELLNLALTNNPFLDGHTPIKLTRVSAMQDNREDRSMPITKNQDTPPEDETPIVTETVDDRLEDKMEAQDAPADGDGVTEEAAPVAVDFNAWGEALAKATGLDTAAVLSMLEEAMDEIAQRLAEKAEADGTPAETAARKTTADAAIAVLTNTVKALEQRVTALTTKDAARTKAAIEAEADAIIAAGNATDADRDNVIHLLTEDPKRARAIFSRRVLPITEPMQAGDEPEAKPTTIALSSLPENKQHLVRSLMAAGLGDEKACIARALNAEN